MKAMVFTEYGLPDVLRLEEVDKPTPADDEVSIEVQAASVNSWDWDVLRGTPFVNRLMFGLTRPQKVTMLGADVAGRVDRVGSQVTGFAPGDEVFGDLSGCHWGGFADYVCARADVLARKPATMTFAQAAATPQAGALALQGLRQGELQPGQRVLVNGAGGGVGTFAVQIAVAARAEVTGVDRAGKLEMVAALGAHHVIDYGREDYTRNGQRYDLILDMVATGSVFDYRRALSPTGSYVVVGGALTAILPVALLGPLLAAGGGKKLGLLSYKPDPRDLEALGELFQAGKVAPVIDHTYPLAETAEALRRIGAGDVCGKVVIAVRQ